MKPCILIVALVGWLSAGAVLAAEYYVSPNGASANAGSREKPWDIASALGGRQKVGAGDTVWLTEGVYHLKDYRLDVRGLAGSADNPLRVRAVPGERVVLDGRVVVGWEEAQASSHLCLENLEITTLSPDNTRQITGGQGGVDIYHARNFKLINCFIHDNTRVSVGCWAGTENVEIYGCLIFPRAEPRQHCLYTQNKNGVDTISNCIMEAAYPSWTLHGHGTDIAFMDNYVVEDNVFLGPVKLCSSNRASNRNNRMVRNHIVLTAGEVTLGFADLLNECEFRDNIVRGPVALFVKDEQKVSGNVLLRQGVKRDAAPTVVLLPNKYDPERAHLIVWNWQAAKEVPVRVAPFLKDGDGFRLLDPRDPFGKPVLADTCHGAEITVPVAGEFGVFLVVRP